MPLDAAQVSLWLKSNFLLEAELCLTVAMLVLASVAKPPRWMGGLWRQWRGIAARPAAALLLPVALAVGLRVLLLPWAAPAYPSNARDEFSYLLAADTFASGRLANPPHPQFRHFESPHVLFQPTYASKYPPGQGLVLALGEVLGHPWIGVLISISLLIVAAGWAMRAWLPPPYALLGATLLALRVGVMSYWANSYWGGAVAGAGGALLVGALPRLSTKPTPLAGALLGLGLGVMAISRPFEGLIFSAILLGLWAFQYFARTAGRARRASAVLPEPGGVARPTGSHRALFVSLGWGAGVLVAIFLWLGYYHAAVTGDPLVAPYTAWRRMYSRYEAFIWETPVQNYKPVNEAYARFVDWVVESHDEYASPVVRLARMLYQWVVFYWGPMLTLFVVLAVPWFGRTLRMRLLAISTLLTVVTLSVLVDVWAYSHYMAPLAAALAIMGVQAVRIVVAGTRKRFGGPRPSFVFLLLGLPVVLIALNLTGLYLRNTDRLWTTPSYDTGWCCYSLRSERARVEDELMARPGKHLVFVRHPPEGYWGAEWVYNGASIDDGKIVWAREVSPESDCELRRYYSDRHVWVTYVHEQPAQASPFPDPSCGVSGGEAGKREP